ncbi:hypothetical protein MAM1_0061c03825 [Mucor ambiguus]|uniref:Uncharacterized protein n=1 Tax=Mucor ambiguus TaxID=91626 RepID=A0A0C9LU41_9FUNG|nr:hypothetical protein MAM1_0061c03825 [Mucor ambiguus]
MPFRQRNYDFATKDFAAIGLHKLNYCSAVERVAKGCASLETNSQPSGYSGVNQLLFQSIYPQIAQRIGYTEIDFIATTVSLRSGRDSRASAQCLDTIFEEAITMMLMHVQN